MSLTGTDDDNDDGSDNDEDDYNKDDVDADGTRTWGDGNDLLSVRWALKEESPVFRCVIEWFIEVHTLPHKNCTGP